jgi:hypothetical protein
MNKLFKVEHSIKKAKTTVGTADIFNFLILIANSVFDNVDAISRRKRQASFQICRNTLTDGY